jgi:hypothetical protein
MMLQYFVCLLDCHFEKNRGLMPRIFLSDCDSNCGTIGAPGLGTLCPADGFFWMMPAAVAS